MLDQIKVLITGDGAKLTAALNTASGQIAAFGRKAQASLSRVGSQLGAIGAIGGGALTVWAKRNIDALDELGKASIRTGVAVEDLAKLRYAGQLADVDIPTLEKALARLNKTLGEARQGNEAAIQALAGLGVAATDSLLPAMSRVADTMAALPDAADRAARMSAVFGREWATLVPMLENGGEELQRLGDELELLGGVPTKQATDAAQEFNDNITRLGVTLAGPFNAALRDALPPLAAISQSFVNASSAAGGFFKLFENYGAKLGLQARLAVVNTEFERLRASIDYVNAQIAKGYLERTPERDAEVAAGVEKLRSMTAEIARLEAKIAELDKKPDIASLTVGVVTDPMAVQNVTAGAIAASKAAQAAVPPIVVPIALGTAGAITNYADLKQEFLRQQEGMATGGAVSGPGTSTSDSILARLSAGEYVVRASAVRAYGRGLLDAINAQRFAVGGLVGPSKDAGGASAGSERFSIQLSGGSYTAQVAPDVGAALRRELRREIARRGTR